MIDRPAFYKNITVCNLFNSHRRRERFALNTGVHILQQVRKTEPFVGLHRIVGIGIIPGTASNKLNDGPGKHIEDGGVGYSCIAEIRTIETINDGKPSTSFMQFGDQVTLADALLVPQVYNARRFKVPLDDYPRLVAAVDHCNELAAFKNAEPEAQSDAT